VSVPFEYSLTPGLAISFQRFPAPPSGLLRTLPPSHGALPLLAAGAGRVLVPVPDGEALWVGLVRQFRAPSCSVRVSATLASGQSLDVWTGRPPTAQPPPGPGWMAVPPHFAVAGLVHPDGWSALARPPAPADPGDRAPAPACVSLDVTAWDEHGPFLLHADLVSVEEFAAAGGRPPAALDPSAPGDVGLLP
jgi:hypothetical protein